MKIRFITNSKWEKISNELAYLWWGIKYDLWDKHQKEICSNCKIETTVEHLYPCDFCDYNDH